MRVVILSSLRRHFASLALPALVAEPSVDLALVVLSAGAVPGTRRTYARKLRKMLRIGPLGALNGLRMRSWFNERVAEQLGVDDLQAVCARHGVPFEGTPRINCKQTRKLFRDARPDLGLSLGNSWIGPKLFSIPEQGMINVHHEVLPRYRGALPVVWQIHDGSRETGYTIHSVERKIDAGAILHRETIPIEFRDGLAATATHNYGRSLRASVKGLIEVVRDFGALAAAGSPQGPAESYTTPTYREYRRMVRQHRRLAAASASAPRGPS